MRFIGYMLVTFALCGCSFTPGSLQFNSNTEPMPADHRSALESARAEQGWVALSEPRTLLGQTVFAPRRWYVCVMTEDGTQSAVVLSNGEIAGVIAGEPPELCAGVRYEAWI